MRKVRSRRYAPLVLLTLATILAACGNGEPRPPCALSETAGEVGTICGFRNPEDIEFLEDAGLILATNLRMDGPVKDGGDLSALVLESGQVMRLWPPIEGDVENDTASAAYEEELGAAGCIDPPPAEAFYPHGATSRRIDDRTLVYITGHAGELGSREAVEIFELLGHGTDARLVWKACIPTENAIQANDIAIAPDGEIVVSNYQPDGSVRNTLKSVLFGSDTGDVMAWSKENGWRHLEGTDSQMANGIAISRDGKNVLYSETVTGALHRTPRVGKNGSISVSIGGNPDNFTWTDEQTLLVATHTGGAAFMACLFGRTPCTTSWEIWEIDPTTLAVSKIFEHDGSDVGAVATALRVGDRIYVSSVFDDRIGVILID